MTLIDRDELLKFKQDVYDYEGHLLYAVPTGIILKMPTVDAVPVQRGRWIEDDATYPGPGRSNYICSECKQCGGAWLKGLKSESLFAYCPNCGADMREGEKDG